MIYCSIIFVISELVGNLPLGRVGPSCPILPAIRPVTMLSSLSDGMLHHRGEGGQPAPRSSLDPGLPARGGFGALTSIPYGMYKTGMMCSDIKFPRCDLEQYSRFMSNVQLLLDSGRGLSFYDGITALNIVGSFYDRYPTNASVCMNKVGLIVCEHIWPSGAGSGFEFHLSVVRGISSARGPRYLPTWGRRGKVSE